MADVLRSAAQLVEHVLEALHAGLVGLRLLGREDGVEGRAELLDIVRDLAVHGVGQDHQRNLLRDRREAGRNVRVRPPARHALVDGARVLGPEGDAVALAGALHGVVDDLGIGLPGTRTSSSR